ncbi:MAG: hypothetical protein IPI34_13700 [bacterium]|nr:hypothetical protein [bacterium]
MRTHGSGEFLILVAGIILLAPGAALAQPRGYENHQVVRIEIAGAAQLQALRDLDAASREFEIWSESLQIGVVEARVSPELKRELVAGGFAYTVLIDDLQARIDEMYADQGQGFFDEYRTYEEHLALMYDLAARYPLLASTVDLGPSVQGRALMALRITGPGASKVGLLYHGAQHGNEQAGAMLVAGVAEHLLANYATDPQVRSLVDNAEWYLLPIMNPDGYAVYGRYNAHGFDLNRNWGTPGSGPHPFSEPETAALRDFFLTHPNVRLHLDVHGYDPWFGWPWAHTSETCPDYCAFHAAGDAVRTLIAAAGGAPYAIGAIAEITYPVTGSSVDYSYGDLHQWAYALELASPAIPDIYDHYVSSLLFLASWVSDCNGNGIPDLEEIAGGGVPDANDNGIPDACDIATGHFVDVPSGLAIRLALHESRPNPFNPRTTIAFDLPQDMAVDLSIYDVRGACVCTLVDAELPPGSHQAVWDGRDAAGRGMASGSYFARLEAGGKVETVRMCLVR